MLALGAHLPGAAAIWRSAAVYVFPDTCTLPGKPVDSMRLAKFTLCEHGSVGSRGWG